jgi:hypothetical protein
MEPNIIIPNYEAIKDLESYIRKRFAVQTRFRYSESADWMRSLEGDPRRKGLLI